MIYQSSEKETLNDFGIEEIPIAPSLKGFLVEIEPRNTLNSNPNLPPYTKGEVSVVTQK